MAGKPQPMKVKKPPKPPGSIRTRISATRASIAAARARGKARRARARTAVKMGAKKAVVATGRGIATATRSVYGAVMPRSAKERLHIARLRMRVNSATKVAERAVLAEWEIDRRPLSECGNSPKMHDTLSTLRMRELLRAEQKLAAREAELADAEANRGKRKNR